MTWFSVPEMTWFVTGAQFVLVRLEFCCRLNPDATAGQAKPTVFVPVRKIRKTGAEGAATLNAAICINHAPEFSGAVALYGPGDATN